VGTLIIGFLHRMMPCIAVLKASGVDLHSLLERFDVPPPVLGHHALMGWLDVAVANGQLKPCNTSTLAFAFMGSLHGRTMLQHLVGSKLPDFDSEQYCAEVVDLLLMGLDPAEGT
jgi:hypothetical protein